MHDYPPLVSGALHLLFRHFSQRQEVLHAFRQVQLLVSDSDVESYKQIKSDLDVLRQSVEKSELWVYKSKSAEDAAAGGSSASAQSVKKQKSLNLSNYDEDDGGGGVNTSSNKSESEFAHLVGKRSTLLKKESVYGMEGPSLNAEQNAEYTKIKEILIRMNKLCVSGGEDLEYNSIYIYDLNVSKC